MEILGKYLDSKSRIASRVRLDRLRSSFFPRSVSLLMSSSSAAMVRIFLDIGWLGLLNPGFGNSYEWPGTIQLLGRLESIEVQGLVLIKENHFKDVPGVDCGGDKSPGVTGGVCVFPLTSQQGSFDKSQGKRGIIGEGDNHVFVRGIYQQGSGSQLDY